MTSDKCAYLLIVMTSDKCAYLLIVMTSDNFALLDMHSKCDRICEKGSSTHIQFHELQRL